MSVNDYATSKTDEAIAAFQKYGKTEETLNRLKDHYVIVSEGHILTIPHGFGHVLFTAITSFGFVFYTWFKAWQARRDYFVPQIYNHSEKFMVYNCIFRSYKSTHELHSRFLFYLIFSGMEWPATSLVAGMFWLWGRYFYVRGYHTGDAENRYDGWWHCIGFQIVQFGALRYALKRLFW